VPVKRNTISKISEKDRVGEAGHVHASAFSSHPVGSEMASRYCTCSSPPSRSFSLRSPPSASRPSRAICPQRHGRSGLKVCTAQSIG
jgi:hypothetical protein